MGGFSLLLRTAINRRDWRTTPLASLWHGLFSSAVAFAVVLVISMSLESRGSSGMPASLLNQRTLAPSLLAALLGGLWGFWNKFLRFKKEDQRLDYLREDLEWSDTFCSAILLAAVLMYCVMQAFKIPSGSMRNTLLEGDHLFVNKFVYGIRVPFTQKRVFKWKKVRHGDVVVFQFPTDEESELHCGSVQYGKDFIKRAVGLPGDKIEVKLGLVYRNGTPLHGEPYVQHADILRQSPPRRKLPAGEYQKLWENRELDKTLGDVMRDYFGPVTVPEGSYFVMGDNRDRSCDSRFWGPVPDRYLKGRAWFVYWPPPRMKFIR